MISSAWYFVYLVLQFVVGQILTQDQPVAHISFTKMVSVTSTEMLALEWDLFGQNLQEVLRDPSIDFFSDVTLACVEGQV